MDDLDSYSIEELRSLLENLREEHREIDSTIAALESIQPRDQLKIIRFKKRKLTLKDQIAQIEDRLLPNIIA